MYKPSQIEGRRRIGNYAVNDAVTILNIKDVGYCWDIQEGMPETTITKMSRYADGSVDYTTQHKLQTSLLFIFE